MKKSYKMIVDADDEFDEDDSLSEALENIGTEGILLDTGDGTIVLPPELAKYLEETGILGMA